MFQSIRDDCVASGELYEDPDFRACNSSLYYDREPDRTITWMRPSVRYGMPSHAQSLPEPMMTYCQVDVGQTHHLEETVTKILNPPTWQQVDPAFNTRSTMGFYAISVLGHFEIYLIDKRCIQNPWQKILKKLCPRMVWCRRSARTLIRTWQPVLTMHTLMFHIVPTYLSTRDDICLPSRDCAVVYPIEHTLSVHPLDGDVGWNFNMTTRSKRMICPWR